MRRGYTLLAVPLVAGALALVWWAPWSSSPDPVTRAREAFGTRPVVHVVARGAAGFSGDEIEAWYQTSRRRLHVVVRRGSKVVVDDLAESSCCPYTMGFASPPTLEEFVTSYRSDLAEQRFRVEGAARIEGRRVLWLESPALEVAVDPVSYQAIWIRAPGMTRRTQLVTAETIPLNPADFVLLRNRKPRHL